MVSMMTVKRMKHFKLSSVEEEMVPIEKVMKTNISIEAEKITEVSIESVNQLKGMKNVY